MTKDEYQQLCAGLEPPGFIAWFHEYSGTPAELGDMQTYWLERNTALCGWWAASNPGMSWPAVLERVGYGARARDFNAKERDK